MNNCLNCKERSVFPGHEFCGRTCASDFKNKQLPCKNCHFKKSHPGHDFCGKKCAQEFNTKKQPPCKYCKEKPAHRDYDFCSQKCGEKFIKEICHKCEVNPLNPGRSWCQSCYDLHRN
jgi:hypothetical protein